MAAEAEEIVEEIEVIVEETMEEIEVVAEVAPEVDGVININTTIEESMESLNLDFFDGFISSDSGFESEIQSEVSVTSESLIESAESQGAVDSEIGAQTGSEIAIGSSLQRAGSAVLRFAKGSWHYIKITGGWTKKFVEVYILVDFVGRSIDQIISAIKDSTKNPKWKGSLTEKEKDQLFKLNAATGTLRPLFNGWQKACAELEKDKYISYGTMVGTVGGKKTTVQVIDVCGYILLDSMRQMEWSKALVKNGIDDLTIFDLNQLTNYVFACFANAQALIDLRDNKNNLVKDDLLKTYKFPSPDNDAVVQKSLLTNFPSWSDGIKKQGFSLASLGASMATSAFTKSQAVQKIEQYLRENVYPVIKKAGKEAGQQAATDYVNSEKPNIILQALIPIVGPEKAREYGKKVQKEAIKKAHEAAQKAGAEKGKEIQNHIEADLKPVLKDVVDENTETMKLISKIAAKQILNTLTPAGGNGSSAKGKPAKAAKI